MIIYIPTYMYIPTYILYLIIYVLLFVCCWVCIFLTFVLFRWWWINCVKCKFLNKNQPTTTSSKLKHKLLRKEWKTENITNHFPLTKKKFVKFHIYSCLFCTKIVCRLNFKDRHVICNDSFDHCKPFEIHRLCVKRPKRDPDNLFTLLYPSHIDLPISTWQFSAFNTHEYIHIFRLEL